MRIAQIPSRKYLLDADRNLDLRNMRFYVSGERRDINRLSDSSSHTIHFVQLRKMRADIIWKTVSSKVFDRGSRSS